MSYKNVLVRHKNATSTFIIVNQRRGALCSDVAWNIQISLDLAFMLENWSLSTSPGGVVASLELFANGIRILQGVKSPGLKFAIEE